MSEMTPEALYRAGLEALRRELGVVGMVRFLQQLDNGSGDYTAERWQWLPAEMDAATLVQAIQEDQRRRKAE